MGQIIPWVGASGQNEGVIYCRYDPLALAAHFYRFGESCRAPTAKRSTTVNENAKLSEQTGFKASSIRVSFLAVRLAYGALRNAQLPSQRMGFTKRQGLHSGCRQGHLALTLPSLT